MAMSLLAADGSLNIALPQIRCRSTVNSKLTYGENTAMPENNSNNSTDPLPMPSVEERLSKIEIVLTELLVGQKQVLSELSWMKEDAKQRYVDLRERVDLNNDKLDVTQREFYKFVKDMRNPPLTAADRR